MTLLTVTSPKKKSWLRLLATCLMLLASTSSTAKAEPFLEGGGEPKDGPLQALREKYDELPTGAKVAAAGAAGFVTSRVALKTFVSAAKIAGAAFIATEVMFVSGVLDNMPDYVEGQVQNVHNAKERVLVEARKFRKGVRETLKKERVAGLGFATGAFVGIAL